MELKLAGFLATLSLLAGEAHGEEMIHVGATAPFADPSSIAANVREECTLPEEQMHLFLREAAGAFIPVDIDERAVAAREGRVLTIEITRAVSKGAVYLPFGHSKEVALRGTLFENGAEVASFEAMRGSRGGMFGAFQSSCDILYRCQARLATDIVLWLRSPKKDARLGEYGE